MEIGSIFLGNTPNEQRMFLKHTLSHLRQKGYEKIIVPCCGQFVMVKAAIEAGYKKENIFASEISLFSNLLGYYYSEQNINDIQYKVLDEVESKKHKSFKTDEEKLAQLFYLMKVAQIRKDVFYENEYLIELIENREKYIKNLIETLKKHKAYYSGINYEHSDLRLIIEKPYCNKTILLVNPPAFAKGYTKMFSFGEIIEYDPNVEEWDLKKEYLNTFQKCIDNDTTSIFYMYQKTGRLSEYAIFGKKYTNVRTDFWLITKPELVKDMKGYMDLVQKNEQLIHFKKYKIADETLEIKNNSKVDMVLIPKETAFLYRDLWAHKLGATNCEATHLILIDGLICGVVGWHTADLRRMKSDYIFEVFCFNPKTNYQKLNRLLMMFLTSMETKKLLLRDIFKTNRYFNLNGVKTTCLSKYRKVKLNNGILNVTKREKMDNGLYKIVYETDFYNRTYNDCINIFLNEKDG